MILPLGRASSSLVIEISKTDYNAQMRVMAPPSPPTELNIWITFEVKRYTCIYTVYGYGSVTFVIAFETNIKWGLESR